MDIMTIRFQKILLEKFVDKIRFNYSNSFPEKPPIRFQEKRLHEKRLICFQEPRAYI